MGTQLQDRMPPKGKRGRPKKGDEKKQRKKKDPNAPKRPMSAYFLFMNATRPTVRKENPDASIGEVAKILGKMWGEIEPADKAKYDKDAAAGTKKTRRRRRPRTANRKGKVESCQKEPKGAVTNSPQAEKPERLPGTPLSRPYFDTSSLKYVFQNMYFDSILFKIRIFKIRTLKYLSS